MKKTCDNCGCETDACINCGNIVRREIEMIGGSGSYAVYHCKDGCGCLRESATQSLSSIEPPKVKVVFTGGLLTGQSVPLKSVSVDGQSVKILFQDSILLTPDDIFTIKWS